MIETMSRTTARLPTVSPMASVSGLFRASQETKNQASASATTAVTATLASGENASAGRSGRPGGVRWAGMPAGEMGGDCCWSRSASLMRRRRSLVGAAAPDRTDDRHDQHDDQNGAEGLAD